MPPAEKTALDDAIERALAPYRDLMTDEELAELRAVLERATQEDAIASRLANVLRDRPSRLTSEDRDVLGNPVQPPADAAARGRKPGA